MDGPHQTEKARIEIIAARLLRISNQVQADLAELADELQRLDTADPWVGAQDRPGGLSPSEFRARAKRGAFPHLIGARGKITARQSDVLRSLEPPQQVDPSTTSGKPDFAGILERAGLKGGTD